MHAGVSCGLRLGAAGREALSVFSLRLLVVAFAKRTELNCCGVVCCHVPSVRLQFRLSQML